jgi:muramidase (phage lysozyme)
MSRVAKAAPILALIRRNESEGAARSQGVASAYDVVWSGIKPDDRPQSPLTHLTVARVLWWQDVIDSIYMSEAAGAYQFLEDTLRGLNFDPAALFDEKTQDGLALQLLDRRGWAKCEAGAMSVEDFADNLAREWASLPVVRAQKGQKRAVKAGQSFYAGDGLNKAHATPADVLEAIHAALQTDPPAAPADGPEGAVVAWLMAAPPEARVVASWLAAAPQGVF